MLSSRTLTPQEVALIEDVLGGSSAQVAVDLRAFLSAAVDITVSFEGPDAECLTTSPWPGEERPSVSLPDDTPDDTVIARGQLSETAAETDKRELAEGRGQRDWHPRHELTAAQRRQVEFDTRTIGEREAAQRSHALEYVAQHEDDGCGGCENGEHCGACECCAPPHARLG